MQNSIHFELNPFLSFLPSGSRILDLGCGTGRHAAVLHSAGFGVCGVDFDEDALSTAQALYPGLRVCAGRAEALPFHDGAFDAVLCVDVLHWCTGTADFDAVWREALRVLRPGGIFGARFLLREFLPGAEEIGEGRYRLETGAEWFLAERADLEARASRAGEWILPPVEDGDGPARMILRKNPR